MTRLTMILAFLLLLSPLTSFADEIPAHEGVRNPGVAGMLSFFIPGAGHVYCDEYGTGALYFVGTVALAAGAGYFFADSLSDGIWDGDSGGMVLTATFTAGTIVLKGIDIVHAMRTARSQNLELGLGFGPRGQAAVLLNYRF